jgi:hypothetical protein
MTNSTQVRASITVPDPGRPPTGAAMAAAVPLAEYLHQSGLRLDERGAEMLAHIIDYHTALPELLTAVCAAYDLCSGVTITHARHAKFVDGLRAEFARVTTLLGAAMRRAGVISVPTQ